MQLIHGLMDKNKVDGFTITGGEPFYQPEALQALVGELSAICEDIIVYTGYTYMELMENNRAVNGAILSRIAVLIDGRYIEAQNHGAPLRGSDNQGIIFYKQQYWDSYYEYINSSATGIQNFHTADGVISVGIHRPGFNAEIDAAVTRKGLEASND
jgi:anaerobic ribonucleoside-triphosphate reductase activating protein